MKPQERNRAIYASRLDPFAKLVCMAIADHMNQDDQDVYPSVARLSEMTGIAERTVRDVLRAGRSEGWLITTDRPGSTSLLRLDWATLANTDAKRTSGARKPGSGRRGTPAAGAGVDPCTGRTPPLHGAHTTPAPGAPHPCAPPSRGGTPDFREDAAENRQERENAPLRPLPTKEQTNEGTRERTTEPPGRERQSAAPAAMRRPAIHDPDTFADLEPVRVGRRELPGGLTELLFGCRVGRHDAAQMLVNAGIGDTRALLRIPVDRLRYQPRTGQSLWDAVADHLRDTWGIELGALAEAEPNRTRRGASSADERRQTIDMLNDALLTLEAERAIS